MMTMDQIKAEIKETKAGIQLIKDRMTEYNSQLLRETSKLDTLQDVLTTVRPERNKSEASTKIDLPTVSKVLAEIP